MFHATGMWPATLDDETTVEECEPGRLLVLLARGRPFGQARVRIELMAASENGTAVVMHETLVKGPAGWVPQAFTDPLVRRRNTEALSRLRGLVERPQTPAD